MHRGPDYSILSALLASGLLVLLPGCAPGTPPKSAVLRVWDFKYGEAEMGEALREYDRAYEAAHPGVRVDHRGLSDVDDDEVLASAVAANAGPDVAMIHAGAELRALGTNFLPIAPLPAHLSSALPSALDACRDGSGKLIAVPLTVQGFGWYYNKKLFSRSGLDPDRPPASWKEFLAVCERLAAAGIRPIAWGNNPPHGTDWLRRSFAASYYSEEELRRLFSDRTLFLDGRFSRIATLIAELRDRGWLDSKGAYADHIFQASAEFRRGGAGLYLGLLSDIAHWKEFSDALGKDAVGFFGSISLPFSPVPHRLCVQAAGIAYGVLRSGKHQELAVEYAAGFFDGAAAARLISRTGALMPLREAPFPARDYPALGDVLAAMARNAGDIEFHYPDMSVKSALFRYDELFYTTREISLATYLDALARAFFPRTAETDRNSRN